MRQIDNAERRARLGHRHLLAGAGSDLSAVAGAMVGLHSSDPATVYLAARARLTDFDKGELEDALYENKSVLRILGMRRTMFVLPRPLAAIVDAACTQALAPPQSRRLTKLIADQDFTDDPPAWIAAVCDRTLAALEARGEATASELRQDVPELALKVRYGKGEFGMSTRILFLLATEGRIVRGRPRGSWLSTQYRWAPIARWLDGPLPTHDPAEARGLLVASWLGSFGPGTLTDLKWWTGWSLGNTRAALERCGAVEVGLQNGTGYVLADDIDPVAAPRPWAAFLPGLDPTPMGWKERDWYLGNHASDLFDRNGNIGPTVWLDGRIVGGWAQATKGDVLVKLLEPVTSFEQDLIEREHQALARWLVDDLVTPRFRTPLERELSSG